MAVWTWRWPASSRAFIALRALSTVPGSTSTTANAMTLARSLSSLNAHTRSEPELDAAAGRFDAAIEASLHGAGDVLVEAFDGAQRLEVAVDAVEAAGRFGVLGEPVVAAGDVVAQRLDALFDAGDVGVDAGEDGAADLLPALLGGLFAFGPCFGAGPPRALHAAAHVGHGRELLGLSALVLRVDEVACRVAGVGSCPPASAVLEVEAVLAGLVELVLGAAQLEAGIGRDRGGDRVAFGEQTRSAQRGAHRRRGLLVGFDVQRGGGWGARARSVRLPSEAFRFCPSRARAPGSP